MWRFLWGPRIDLRCAVAWYAVAGSDVDAYHFAGLDENYYGGSDSGSAHAFHRDLAVARAYWMSPDPYSGSYDLTNPQSFNRYAYALNNPLSLTDPEGLCTNGASAGDGSGDDSAIGQFVVDIGEAIVDLFE